MNKRSAVLLALLACLLGCDEVRSYRRAPERDLSQFAQIASKLHTHDGTQAFDTFAEQLALKREQSCQGLELRCADGKGRDAFNSTHLALFEQVSPSRKAFSISILAFPLPQRNKVEQIARQGLGVPTGKDLAGDLGWVLPVGVLVADESAFSLRYAESGDAHDVIEVENEPSLPSPKQALTQIHAAIEKRYGTQGYVSGPEKLVALASERQPLPAEACVGNLGTGGQEICFGRGVSSFDESARLEFVHASVTTRRGGAFQTEKVTDLLADVVGNDAARLVSATLAQNVRTPISIRRGGNFAVVVTRQTDPSDPWTFQHIIVMRRLTLFPQREAEIRNAWQNEGEPTS